MSLTLIICSTAMGKVTTFFTKDWQITLSIDNFEPTDVLRGKSLFAGSFNDNSYISIIIEKVDPTTSSMQIREKYGSRSLAFARKHQADVRVE